MEWNIFGDLALRFAINLLSVFIAVEFICRRFAKADSSPFILYVFNLVLFLMSAILSRPELIIGSGFGLFAVFTMIRYRSEQLSWKEMAYLLVMAALGLINSIPPATFTLPAVIQLNALTLLLIALIEAKSGWPATLRKIRYPRFELFKPQHRKVLHRDLLLRLGKKVLELNIENINFLEGVASLKVRLGEDYLPPEGIRVAQLVQEHQNEIGRNLKSDHIGLPFNSPLN
jgi:hypothetical protein